MESSESQSEQPQIIYSTFWERFFALFIDGLILIPFILINTQFNETTWKSPYVYAFIILATQVYKPLCEYKYGATIGKRALKLVVVNQYFQKADIREILLRNIFNIIGGIIGIITTMIIFNIPEFQNVTTVREYSKLARSMDFQLPIMIFTYCLSLTDTIFLLSDKQRRALHDRIGKTVVIKRINN